MDFFKIGLLSLFILLLSWFLSKDQDPHIYHRRVTRLFTPKQETLEYGIQKKIIGGKEARGMDPYIKISLLNITSPLPPNPHRAMQVGIYSLTHPLQYQDFRNRSETLNPNDFILLSAGRASVYSVAPASSQAEFLQIWVKNPDQYWKYDQNFQIITEDQITKSPEQNVTVILGAANGKVSSTICRREVSVARFALKKGENLIQPIIVGWSAAVYVRKGQIKIENDVVEEGMVGVLSQWDSQADIKALKSSDVFLFTGYPLNQMFVNLKTFAMKNYPQTQKGLRHFREGKWGFQGAPEWVPFKNKSNNLQYTVTQTKEKKFL